MADLLQELRDFCDHASCETVEGHSIVDYVRAILDRHAEAEPVEWERSAYERDAEFVCVGGMYIAVVPGDRPAWHMRLRAADHDWKNDRQFIFHVGTDRAEAKRRGAILVWALREVMR